MKYIIPNLQNKYKNNFIFKINFSYQSYLHAIHSPPNATKSDTFLAVDSSISTVYRI